MKSILHSSLKLDSARFQNFLGVEFVKIPAGSSIIGASDGDPDAEENERPAHSIRVMQPFYLATTPVTLGEYRQLADYYLQDHSAFLGEHAVNFISCDDADAYVARLNAARPVSEAAMHYRLPTEIEWEYACRAGTSTRFFYGDDPDYKQLGDYAWYGTNAWDEGLCHPQPVGRKKANAFGLLDMHGNVWEWTADGWASYIELIRKGESARDKATRVLRGGAFCHEGRYIRASDRDHYEPSYRHYYTGFRLCLDILT